MKIIYIGVYKKEARTALELVSAYDLAHLNWMKRMKISPFIPIGASNVATETDAGVRKATYVEDAEHYVHSYTRPEGLCGIIVSDKDYPDHIAQTYLSILLDKFLSDFPRTAYANFAKGSPQLQWSELEPYIKKWDKPADDKMLEVQRQLDETKEILHKTIQQATMRGDKIDDLIAKSDNLNASSKMFYTQAKKQNSCCVVM
ncbi:putative snare protein [Phaeosphaeriaceae sp. PMI808]|nr:putative snare protein [Phaeosphaeriaceae sp. PMI808]